MALTKADLDQIKNLLDEHRQKIGEDTERKITTAIVNKERSVSTPKILEDTAQTRRIQEEIQTAEDNSKKAFLKLEDRIFQRFDSVDKVLSD